MGAVEHNRRTPLGIRAEAGEVVLAEIMGPPPGVVDGEGHWAGAYSRLRSTVKGRGEGVRGQKAAPQNLRTAEPQNHGGT
jgi:hypothetical protein